MFRFVRHSIRRKLMLVVIVTTLAALLFTAIVLVAYDVRTYQRSWVNDLATQAEILGRAAAPALAFDDPMSAYHYLSLLRARPQIEAAAIYKADGTLFATYRREEGAQDFPTEIRPDGHRIVNNQLVLFRGIREGGEHMGTVYLSARYELFERLQSYLVIVGIALVASLLVAFVMSYWLQSAVTRPILEVSDVAHKVAERRDMSLRARKTTEDEVGYLVTTFNDMLGEIERRSAALQGTNRRLEEEMSVRQEAERALLASDQRKDEFLATLAHELRNPLAPLRNALEILKYSSGGSKDALTAREIMERQLRQLVRLVDDLLDVSRITTGKLVLKREDASFEEIIQSALDATAPYFETRQVRLQVTLPAEPLRLRADPTRLAQVFLNLLHNAAKFTDPGGSVTLRAEREGSELQVTVTDTGVGIPEAKMPLIFDMFAQVDQRLERSHSGLGVGLSLARRLVELHGGTIEAASDGLGKGTRFTVRLPAPQGVDDPRAEDAPRAEGERSADGGRRAEGERQRDAAGGSERRVNNSGGPRRILLADDNSDFLESFATMLRDMGHEIHCASDGLEALRMAGEIHPEVAFLDIGLPKLNGYELARRIRELPHAEGMTLIAVTGWGQENDRERARQAGFHHHMIKP
ncbi:MAG TPA: ATP-binding protein, partial [Candidatus Eisenbacteria bacterium]|nr:ATP-binding protein [Candidatus Eisenbacteria bacterium]